MEKTAEQLEKRGPGRPKGSKDKAPRKLPPGYANKGKKIDPVTGIVVQTDGFNGGIIAKMGDEKVTAFVQYHLDCLKMREGCNKKDVPDLYRRFYNYLIYCAQHGVVPNNMNCYLAIGISRFDIANWRNGQSTPEHKEFAQTVTDFFASVHEQAATDGVMNPISAMFWQKAHDGMVEASKLEVVNTDPLGDRQSAEQIAAKYSDVVLPD